ncbi:DeoR/GlpR family DNA-binding transcription regulator [Vagococcus sp. PNs007]|uniref:DeoR/GlpR family DNA-binding transcription regulator n=1 Tax=Vagococcus proximus TaxID=2991417 RepID=A0ABT5WYV7_9ENTE|nr:DeoR/GlpR family DNA-binding transcription regulator [Vagococcus proximus]MDF0478940.1 DeoR/GlpR family DNA-binding transcription regulator [Vagococcus proximus]
MKNTTEHILNRQNKLINLLKINDKMTPHQLSLLLDCSINTVRRDINELHEKEALVKKYGYVYFNPDYSPNFDSFGPTKIKEEIAKFSSSLIKNEDTVFINSSSTALKSLNYLNHHSNTIITNNMHIFKLDLDTNKKIILTGGTLRPNKKSLTGLDAIKLLETKFAQVCIVGCYGISLETGHVFSSVMTESKINETMVKHTTRTKILLADYRKFGKESEDHFANIKDFDYIITDSYLPNIYINQLEKYNIQLIQVTL